MRLVRILEHVLVIGLWTIFIFYIVSLAVLDHYRSVTIFALLVPLVIHWVLGERLFGMG